MGYRSDGTVRIAGTRDGILDEVAKLMLTGDEHIKHVLLNDFSIVMHGDGLMLGLDYENWKMYPNYTDVIAMKAVWNHFKGMEDKFEGAWIRLGEEDDDTEIHYFGDEPYELANVGRSIRTQFDISADDDIRKTSNV